MLEFVQSRPDYPKCKGPPVLLKTSETLRAGSWATHDYYLAAGSQWTSSIAASGLVTVLQMTVCHKHARTNAHSLEHETQARTGQRGRWVDGGKDISRFNTMETI